MKICPQCAKPHDHTSHVWCKPCYNAWRREWRRNNKDKMGEQKQRALLRDPERFKRAGRASYLKHRIKKIAKSRRWNVENKAAVASREAVRRAKQKKATPLWADLKAIESVYTDAYKLFLETNIRYQVDHIVPLKSDIVCGLHVPWNLQIITPFENQSKNNHHWPDMP